MEEIMDKENKNFDIISFLFNNESFINGLLENLKKELMEVIFSDNLSLFKKSIFIEGVFTYANLILSNNTSMSNEEKNKIVTNPRVVRLTLKSIIWIKQIFSPTLNR